jgi:8-oxo-dGTP diphosphatase
MDSPARGPRRSVAGIAVRGRRIFIARRKEGGDLGGKWEFPGGKAEEDETDAQALIREFLEEFGVTIAVGPCLGTAFFEHRGRTFILNAYHVFFGPEEFQLREHTEWRWAEPEEIEKADFAESDLGLIPFLKRNFQ